MSYGHLDCSLEWALLLGPYVIYVGQEGDSAMSPRLLLFPCIIFSHGFNQRQAIG